MKKCLLILLSLILISYSGKLQAQCNFLNPGVKLNFTQAQGGGGCLINIDLSFDLEHNDGNKWVNLHIWRTSQYPVLPYNDPPTAAQLANAAATIVIDQRTNPIKINTTYPPDNGVTPQSAGVTVTRVVGASFDRYTITNISLVVPTGCNVSQSFTGDAWSSQSTPDNNVHCFTDGFSFLANDPEVNGLLFCQIPRQYTVSINTTSASTISGTYDVFRDNGDNFFDSNTDALVANDVPWSAVSGTPYQSGLQGYTGNGSKPEADRILFVVVSTNTLSNTVIEAITNTCIPLPVNFKSFTAERNRSEVLLKWETMTEQLNRGFAVERNTGSNEWKEIAFVPSQAPGGNSNAVLAYQYNDLNNIKGMTQYRIRQVDLDDRSRYSEIRAVRGEGQTGKTIIYPNPSNNGRVTVVFEDTRITRDISLLDMSGRLVKQWKAVVNNNITIDHLTPGMYSLRVIALETGEQTMEKIIVNQR